MSKTFIILGMGYVSRKHLKAISDIGGKIAAFYEPCHENVGYIQEYCDYDVPFFKELERLDRFVFKQQQSNEPIDYCSILSMNYLHEPQARWAMRNGMNAIIEKPVCTHLHNLDALIETESETEKRAYPVLQLRYHEKASELIEKCSTGYHKVRIDYASKRYSWYFNTWKADDSKSGQLFMNIGIHLADMSSYLFGKYESVNVIKKDQDMVIGSIEFERAHVDFRLSIKMDEQPRRIFEIDGECVDFSNSFNDLHTTVYQKIMAGEGMTLEDTRESIKICQQIREWNQHEHRRCA